jgi:hypothetical protein
MLVIENVQGICRFLTIMFYLPTVFFTSYLNLSVGLPYLHPLISVTFELINPALCIFVCLGSLVEQIAQCIGRSKRNA